MNSPEHVFQLIPAPRQRDSERVQIVTRRAVPKRVALFRAPALPTLHQLSSELPFTVNFRTPPRLQH